jgi:hypothetical protein
MSRILSLKQQACLTSQNDPSMANQPPDPQTGRDRRENA